jgi:DNA-binding GntR family transcriptional regulator
MTETSAVGRTGGAEGGSSLGDDVYWKLRQEIVRGELRPNQALAEVDIAERLSVSRTPVRESMQRLASDGLVVSRRRRWIVYEHTKREIQEIYEVRSALEGYAARLASQRITDEQIATLTGLTDTGSPVGDLIVRVERNEDFHNRIVTIAGNERLASQLIRNRDYSFNRQVASLYTPDDLVVSAKQHTQLIAAVCKRDAPAAEEIAQAHVEAALRIIIARLP